MRKRFASSIVLAARARALGAVSAPAPATGVPGRRWLWGGVLLGSVVMLVSQLPASWLAGAVARATEGRVQLAEAQGTLWHGSALPVLTGGPGSLDARVLPSRLEWRLAPMWLGLRLQLTQDCCMPGGVALEWQPRWRAGSLDVKPAVGDTIGQWPAAWLEGLGAPWNTLKPGGQLKLVARSLHLQQAADGWQATGQAELELLQTSSRVSPLNPLGSYRITLSGHAGQPATIALQTLEGALQLQGSGELRARGLRFRGDARAAPGQESALNNLLNIIGRRQGATSVISIG